MHAFVIEFEFVFKMAVVNFKISMVCVSAHLAAVPLLSVNNMTGGWLPVLEFKLLLFIFHFI